MKAKVILYKGKHVIRTDGINYLEYFNTEQPDKISIDGISIYSSRETYDLVERKNKLLESKIKKLYVLSVLQAIALILVAIGILC